MTQASGNTVLTWGPLRVDLIASRAWAAERLLALPPLEVRLLGYLIESPERVCMYREIAERVFGASYVSAECHRRSSYLLRRALGTDLAKIVVTVSGVGLRLTRDGLLQAPDDTAQAAADHVSVRRDENDHGDRR